MPELNGFRVLNLAYGESFVIPDLTLDFGGRNTLILMPNGAGKTYLLSCFFQTILPGTFLQPRTVDDLFSKCSGTSHILAAFSTEKETVYLGFCTRKRADRTYFNWVLRFNEPIALERLPLRRGEAVLDYEELPLLMKSLYGDRFDLYRRETLDAYEQRLTEFGLYSEEWRLILSFNQFLEGVVPLQEVLPNTSDKILDPMVFPLLEKRLQRDGIGLRETIAGFFSHLKTLKPVGNPVSRAGLIDRLDRRLSMLREYQEANEDVRNAVCSLRAICQYTQKERLKNRVDAQQMGCQIAALEEEEAECLRQNDLRIQQDRFFQDAKLEKAETELTGLIEEKQRKVSLLFDALRRRMNVETAELPVDKHPALFSEMQTNASISWALMTKHHLETLLETVKNDQVRRETELQSYWETRLTQRRCAGLHERYQKYGGMLRYQKIGYEKERTIHALERIWRRQVIQKALRKKLRQKLGGFANDRERAEAKIAEADRLGEQIQAYRDFVEVLKSLDGNRPLQIIAERLQEKRHRLHIRLYQGNKEIERIDQLEMKEAGPIGIKAPEEVEKLAFALVQNGFSGFEKGSDWVRTGKSNNPFLTFALITEYPLEMDQVLSRLPPEAFPPLPIPILSVREAETLVEAGEYRTIMRMKLRWVPSLTERALRLRLDPGSRASEENGLSRERDLSRWLQTNRAVHHAQIENLGAAIKKTEGQIERLALFAHTLGPDPEAAYERQAEHRLSLERDLRLLSKSIDGYLEKIEESEVLSRSLGEEERVLRLKAGSLDREEQEWSLLSSEIEQVCNIPLKDFSIFFLSIQKRLSELEAKAQETEGSMDESLSELRNPLLSLIAREPQTDPSVFDAHPALLWEILTEIRSLELELQSLFHERATLSARRQRGGNAEALPKPDSPPARGGEGDPKEEGVSEVVESAETLERRIREIEEKREEIKQSIAEGDRAQRALESLVGRQERLLAEIGIREKKYIPGLARLFLKKDLYGLWEENETEYRKRLYAAERLRQQLDKEWAELKRMLDPSENWEEPILEASEDEGLEGGFSVIARLLSVLKRRINEEKSEERRTHAALSHFSKEIGSVMETLNAHLRDIAHFSRPGPEAAPLLEFSVPRHSPEEYAENFSKRLSEYIARQRAQQQDVCLQWPLRTLWEFYYDQRLEIRIDKPPFTRSSDGKYAWKDVEKWSTGEKMAVYLVLYACLFAWWKGHAASPQPSSILVLDHLFGHINTETLLEIPMRMLYTHNFQIIGFTSSAEPFLFKYFPKWIGLSPQETDHYNFFLPFHVER